MLASDQPFGSYGQPGIAADGGNVYWTTTRGLMAVSKGGGPVMTLAGISQAPGDITLDASRVYWAGGTGVYSIFLQGGSTALQLFADPSSEISRVTLGQGKVIYTRGGSEPGVWQVPITGGTPMPLVTGQKDPRKVVVDATSIYWLDWRMPAKSAVMKAPREGGTPVVISETERSLDALGVGMYGELYWVDGGALKTNSGSGGVVTTLAEGFDAHDILVDQDFVYVLAGTSLNRVPRNGNKPETLAEGLSNATRLAMDGNYIFWIDLGEKTVRKVAK